MTAAEKLALAPLVLIHWKDAFPTSGGWTPFDEALKDADQERVIQSVGIVIVDTPDRLAVAQSIAPDSAGQQISDVLTIPRSALLSVKTLAAREESDQ